MSIACRQLATAEVCYTDGAGVRQTLVAHYEYREAPSGATILHATRYTTAAGVPVDTSAGTVVVGACPVGTPDVEWELLCDTDAAGVTTQFFRRSITSFDANGAVIVPVAVTNWALDKITPYVVAGVVTACPDDCDVVAPVGLVITWG